MADRLLLESSTTDGYQLEDGSGVVLEDGTAFERAVVDLGPDVAWFFRDADAGTPANSLNDQFTATDGTALSAHTADSSDTWTQHPQATITQLVASNRIYPNGAGAGLYYSSDVPASADYYVEAKVRCVSNEGNRNGICARLDTVANTCYRVVHVGSISFNYWLLQKVVAGVATQLGSTYTDPLSAGDERVVQLKVEADSIAVSIDGVSRIEATDTVITAKGRAGVFGNGGTSTTGYHLDYVTSRGFKNQLISENSGAHVAIAVGEYTANTSGYQAGEGALNVAAKPEKGGYMWGFGYSPFAASSSRTFVGLVRQDVSALGVLFGGKGAASQAAAHLPVLEFVGYDLHYSSDVAVTGIFGVRVWYNRVPAPPATEWVLWALTVVGNGTDQTIELFINGESHGGGDVTTAQTDFHADAGEYMIGARGQGLSVLSAGHALGGAHGLQAVYNRALSASEIQGLALTAGLADANSAPLDLTWDTPVAVDGGVLDFKWDLAAGVDSGALDLTWDLAGAANSGAEDLTWDLAAAVVASETLKWDLAGAVAQVTTLLWDLGGALDGPVLDLLWDLASIGAVNGNPLTLPWDLAAAVEQPGTLRWDLAASVASTERLAWDLAAAVTGGAEGLVWDLATPANAGAIAVLWDVYARTDALALRAVWDLYGAVRQTGTLVWDLAAAVNTATERFVWDLAAGISPVDAPALHLVADLRAAVNASAVTVAWDLLAGATAPSLALRWDLVAAVAHAAALRWGLRVATEGLALAVLWDVRLPVDAAVRSLVWDLYGGPARELALVWNYGSDVASDLLRLRWHVHVPRWQPDSDTTWGDITEGQWPGGSNIRWPPPNTNDRWERVDA